MYIYPLTVKMAASLVMRYAIPSLSSATACQPLPTYKVAIPHFKPLPINRSFQTPNLQQAVQHFLTMHMIEADSCGYGSSDIHRHTDILIQRIMHHAYTTEALNNNQYGFTPKKSTVDAVTDVRQHIEPHLNRGEVAIIISLDIQEAFGSAWWPALLQRLT